MFLHKCIQLPYAVLWVTSTLSILWDACGDNGMAFLMHKKKILKLESTFRVQFFDGVKELGCHGVLWRLNLQASGYLRRNQYAQSFDTLTV